MKISEKLNGKRVLIWGFGREGKATKQFLDSHADCDVEVLEGGLEEIDFDRYDFVVKSPGIRCEIENEKLTSQTELFLEEFRDQMVGITGTKGKSTTSSLLYTVLERCGKKAVLVGNIGLPCLNYYDEIGEDTAIVFEMSCHQLAHTKKSPHIAVMLNLYEDHLDYYGTMEAYFDAKLHIIRYQEPEDLCFLNRELPITEKIPGKCIRLDPKNLGNSFTMALSGQHNQYNAQIVFLIATKVYHLPEDQVRKAIREFRGLSHRLELIGTRNGVSYYDDSISTICESAIQAAESIPDVQTILIGGMDRGINYEVLADYLLQHTDLTVICMYASGERVYHMLSGRDNTFLCEDLKEAVETAKRETKPGHACVLSPAAASYDHFKNFEERGDCFRRYVL